MKKFVALIVIIASVMVLTVAGCSLSSKPAPKPSQPRQNENIKTPVPKQDSGINVTPSRNNQDETLASKLAKAAEKVEGVKRATVVVSGSTAFVGLEVESNVDESEVDKVKTNAMKAVQGADDSIKTVNITTDPNLITRLKKIAQGIEDGKPVSSFTKELNELAQRISPKSNVK